ncbi:sperm flagellar 1 [Perkinsus chesapeaki]|uniref:Sperm flagellar 1 n=1 Tax=Perkinsus chesapeaki TaxID=330153 RepID=A0A7J6MPF6_PERCH|nr:sperm flagellar 1 [Perkinsus chesapeaki]
MVVHEPHAPPLASDAEIQKLYNWVDEIPLSRPKRNISRDFADGVMMAEIVAHYVFRRLGFLLHPDDVEECAKAVPGSIERVLAFIRPRLIEAASDGGRGRQFRSISEQRSPRARSEHSFGGARQTTSKLRKDTSPGVSNRGDRSTEPPQTQTKVGRLGDGETDAIMAEKDRTISELRECVELLSRKISKLEQLVRIKDQKVLALQERLAVSSSRALHGTS